MVWRAGLLGGSNWSLIYSMHIAQRAGNVPLRDRFISLEQLAQLITWEHKENIDAHSPHMI